MHTAEDAPLGIPPAAYAKHELRRRAWPLALACAVPLAVCLVAAAADNRFLIVALMLCFIAYPTLMALGWLWMAAKPEIALKTRPQKWTVGLDALTVQFFCPRDLEPAESVAIPFAAITAVEQGSKLSCLYLANDYYLIPTSLLPAELVWKNQTDFDE